MQRSKPSLVPTTPAADGSSRLRDLIYFWKRRAQHHLRFYQFVYALFTFNLDYLRQRLQADQYCSRFGGMWTDRADFAKKLEAKKKRSLVQPETEPLLRRWSELGYVKLSGVIEPELIDAYLAEIAELKSASPSPLLVTSVSLPQPVPYQRQVVDANLSVRTVDDYVYSEAAREILFHSRLLPFIEEVFEARPMLTQSLNFECGSEQAIHQDTAFVIMNSPMKLVGVWIALEDIRAGSGELIYYPGSHRWEGFLFSGRFRHYDKERDGHDQLDQWYRWIEDEAKRRACKPQSFLPKKGDVLIWHAALAHGGAPITESGATRRSLVGHYCPAGVRPFYHYYKPAQRKRYRYGDYLYCSSYYR